MFAARLHDGVVTRFFAGYKAEATLINDSRAIRDPALGKPMADLAAARVNMVESQIRPNRVRDPRLIDALLEIPRERFVPKAVRDVAYIDDDLPIEHDRWLLSPMVFARLVEAAAITSTDRVLEIGGGTGYGAAVLARLAATVVALESDGVMARAARQSIAEMRIANVRIVDGALEQGHPALAPYDVIILGGAVAAVPDRVLAQLAEGGRLVGVVRPPAESASAQMITRVSGTFGPRNLFDATARMLPGFALEAGFVF